MFCSVVQPSLFLSAPSAPAVSALSIKLADSEPLWFSSESVNHEIKSSHTAVNPISCLVFLSSPSMLTATSATLLVSQLKVALVNFFPVHYSSYEWFSVSEWMNVHTTSKCSDHPLVQLFKLFEKYVFKVKKDICIPDLLILSLLCILLLFSLTLSVWRVWRKTDWLLLKYIYITNSHMKGYHIQQD